MKWLISILLCLMYYAGVSQDTAVYYQHDSNNISIQLRNARDYQNQLDIEAIDTGLQVLHLNDNRYLLEGRQSQGNIGQVSNTIRPFTNPLEFSLLGSEYNRINRFTSDDLLFYQVKKPYTSISYQIGSNSEQRLDLIHTQNVTRNFNIALLYSRYGSEGFYLRQNTQNSNAGLSSNFLTSDGRYGFKLQGAINVGRSEENGGLQNQELFTDHSDSITNRAGYPINISGAENQFNDRFISLDQFIRFWKMDSSRVSYHIQLGLNTKYQLEDFRYEDTSPDSFYNNYFAYDSGYVQDHIQLRTLTISPYLRYYINKHHSVEVGVDHNYYDYYMSGSDTVLNQQLLSGNYHYDDGDLYLDLSVKSTLYGYGNGGYQYRANLKKNLNDSTGVLVGAKANYQSGPVFYDYTYYQNSYQYYRNTFDQVKEQSYSIGIGWRDYEKDGLEITYRKLEGYTYFDSLLSPKQYDQSIEYITVTINKHIPYIKPVYFDIRASYNQMLQENVPLSMPSIQTVSSVYVQENLFKGVLTWKAGVDVTYFSSFNGQGYMPLGRRYYYQDQVETGDFVMLDAVLAVQVKRVRAFFKFSNVLEGVTKYNYILTPNYPLQDRAYRIGITWEFFN